MQSGENDIDLLAQQFDDIYAKSNFDKLAHNAKHTLFSDMFPNDNQSVHQTLTLMKVLETYIEKPSPLDQKKAQSLFNYLQISIRDFDADKNRQFEAADGRKQFDLIKIRMQLHDIQTKLQKKEVNARELSQLTNDLNEIQRSALLSPNMKKSTDVLAAKAFKQFMTQLKNEIETAKANNEKTTHAVDVFLTNAKKLMKKKAWPVDELSAAMVEWSNIDKALDKNILEIENAMKPIAEPSKDMELLTDTTKTFPERLKALQHKSKALAETKSALQEKGRKAALNAIVAQTAVANDERKKDKKLYEHMLSLVSGEQHEAFKFAMADFFKQLKLIAAPESAGSKALMTQKEDSELAQQLKSIVTAMHAVDDFDAKKAILESEKKAFIEAFLTNDILTQYGQACAEACRKWLDSQLQFHLAHDSVSANVLKYNDLFDGRDFPKPLIKATNKIKKSIQLNTSEQAGRELQEKMMLQSEPKNMAEKASKRRATDPIAKPSSSPVPDSSISQSVPMFDKKNALLADSPLIASNALLFKQHPMTTKDKSEITERSEDKHSPRHKK